jgi:hypothetical protein
MKKVFVFAIATVLFACQLSFASKKNEFRFGMDMLGMSMFTVNRAGDIYGHSFDEGDSSFMFIAPKLEYCYYFAEDPKDKVKLGIGLGINKFFYGDFNPFNVYVIYKVMLPVSDKTKISLVLDVGYGTGTTREGDKNELYNTKTGIEFDYECYSIDLSFMKSVIFSPHGALYDAIMLGWVYRFAI